MEIFKFNFCDLRSTYGCPVNENVIELWSEKGSLTDKLHIISCEVVNTRSNIFLSLVGVSTN